MSDSYFFLNTIYIWFYFFFFVQYQGTLFYAAVDGLKQPTSVPLSQQQDNLNALLTNGSKVMHIQQQFLPLAFVHRHFS